MEWLNKIANPLTERAKSPLYGAYFISWLIWNWEIVLTIIMPNQSRFGTSSLVEYISDNYINIFDCLLIPLIIALLYIYVLPHIDYRIIGFTEEQKRKKIDRKIEIGRKHKVDGDIYYDLKFKFESEKKKIIDADSRASKLKAGIAKRDTTIADLNAQLVYSKNSLDIVQDSHQKLYNRSNLKDVFEGRWHLSYDDNKDRGEEEIDIRGNQYFIIENNKERYAFDIVLPDFDFESKRFTFVKFSADQNRKDLSCGHCINDLRIISNDLFEGHENRATKVTYTKRRFVKKELDI